MEILINQSIGDYGILRELGSGGMGRVYEAIHSVTHRHEAIKILDVNVPASEIQSERFLREIRLQAALNHPNIAAVHNAFWNEDSLVLVCELLEGESLQTLVERGRISRARSIEILSQTLAALSYAHARGVIHRDVSLSNIFVTAASGAVKLVDFGLAKTTSDLNLTQPGTPAGSYHYMSPEQVRGGQSLDARVDIYSCGAVLYELGTGRKVFEGKTAFDLMQAHCERSPVAPRSLNPDMPKELEDVILKALAKNPEDRFQSADSFARALAQVPLAAGIPLAPPLRLPPRARACAVGLSVVAAAIASGALSPLVHTTVAAATVLAFKQTDRLAVRAPASLAASPPVSTVVVPEISVRSKPIPQPSVRTAKLAEKTVDPLPIQANLAEAITEELVAPEAAVSELPQTTPDADSPKAPGKVTKAIKWLNPFRGKKAAAESR